jgi:RNA polymerase sigma-70 factor (ECF subfamily)
MALTDAAALFATHHGQLFKYFRRAVDDPEAARDLTQEVFFRATRAVIPRAANGEATAWLFHVARNLALDYHRNRRRRPEITVLTDSAGRPPSQEIELAVSQALAALSDVDRDVFLMREVAGLGYEEIAAACELTPDAVRSRIHRTRLALRDQLAAPIATSRTTAASRSAHINTRIEP